MVKTGNLVIGVLLGLNFLLAGALYHEKFMSSRANTGAGNYLLLHGDQQLPDITVTDRAGMPVRLRLLVSEGKQALVVLLTPSDCGSCLTESALWHQVGHRTGLPVYVIATSPAADEFWTWADQTDLPPAVFLDTTFVLLDRLEPVDTPLKLLVNTEGAVRWVDPPRLSAAERNQFWEDLAHAMGYP